ncbi:uncharacterized protein LAJ45_03663 [Morchella importuna]|uniref:uncharacterized protein n=1 Tax=Morchella importuna TaxID=1174673 RepID=UPI001E8E44B4|nr:uncharacterized protein LAJ45_03663 [Morchella importuna]KAH8152237.1 hypothetical protein LAJ45_03663 [Morchella importuna]
MAAPPPPDPVVSHTITGAALSQNVTSNKQVRATIKAHKTLLKSPQARSIPCGSEAEEDEADWEGSGDITEPERWPQSVPESEENQPVVYRPYSRLGRGVPRRIRPMTPIDE